MIAFGIFARLRVFFSENVFGQAFVIKNEIKLEESYGFFKNKITKVGSENI